MTDRIDHDEIESWLVALLPQNYSTSELLSMYDRGYEFFRDEEGKTNVDAFTDAIETFALKSFKQPTIEEVKQNPVHTDPGVLSVAMTLAAISIKNHPEYKEHTEHYYDPDMKLLDRLQELWVDHVFWLLMTHDNRVSFLQEIAEEAYARRQQDDRGPPPGRVCTGVKEVEELGGGLYVEVPLEHYNRFCEVRNDDGEIITKFLNGNAYIPGTDLDTKIREMAGRAFGAHISTQEQELPNQQVTWVVNNTPEIQDQITRDLEGKRFEKLFTDDDYPRKLGVIVSAVKTYEYDEVDVGEWLTAEEMFDAVQDYYPHVTERTVVENMSSPLSVSKTLMNFEDHHDVEVDDEGRVKKFKLFDSKKSVRDVEVDEPEDILELPCMENIDAYLMEQKPTRWILYSIARILMSLENDFTMDEMVQFYSRYPWFNKQTTKYQLEYEQRQQMADGRPPNPIGCHNDNRNFSTFCIGLENCQYSIYRSLPMKEEVYDRLGDFDR